MGANSTRNLRCNRICPWPLPCLLNQCTCARACVCDLHNSCSCTQVTGVCVGGGGGGVEWGDWCPSQRGFAKTPRTLGQALVCSMCVRPIPAVKLARTCLGQRVKGSACCCHLLRLLSQQISTSFQLFMSTNQDWRKHCNRRSKITGRAKMVSDGHLLSGAVVMQVFDRLRVLM